MSGGVDRRRFLRRSAAVLGTAGLAGTAGAAGAAADGSTPPTPTLGSSALTDRVPFDGPHQAGILTPQPAAAAFLALDAVSPDRATLVAALAELSTRARTLTRGGAAPVAEPGAPPADSGILGPTIAPDALTVTIGFGRSLFDGRYGFADRRPPLLRTMTAFPDDDLDPAQCQGDVLVQLCAHGRDTVVHATRELLRGARGDLALRWSVDGFLGGDRGPTPHAARRNLLGFRDGTANPDPRDAAAMRRLTWTAGDARTAGGTYAVVRTIRMRTEFWDRVGLREQEAMIGRRRDDGAPLGGTSEGQDPRYDLDPRGARIPHDAHMRLANPRTPATDDQRMLRRAYSYTRGFDAAGQLDQGLAFVAFNQDPERQFATVQRRLAGEPLVDYVTPVGGGYFFLPRGAGGGSDWVGSGLLT